MRLLRRRLAPAILAGVASASCAGAPPPPPVRVEAPPPPPTPPPAPARWVTSQGATLIGPETARGTLVLLGGRRALVRGDGSVETEKVPTPEALQEIALIPAAGGAKLVGRGEHQVFRFDDPLGAPVPLVTSEPALTNLGAGPGLVVVWVSGADSPRLLDLETGQERGWSGLPEPPLRAVAFADEKRGAAIFEVVGPAVTTDGGATWRPATGPSTRDALSMRDLRLRDGALRAFGYRDGPDAALDLDQGRLGPSEPVKAPVHPLLLWVHATGRDPLEAVASGGLELPGGAALATSHGLLARVDPATGVVRDLDARAVGKWTSCHAARAAGATWLACALPERETDGEGEAFDPFGVMRLPLGEGPLTPDKPTVVRNGEAELRTSPSGGAMLTSGCRGDEGGGACVRQPDGKWQTVVTDLELVDRGGGPLADGRVAFLRGIFDDDLAAAGASAGPDEGEGAIKRLHVAALGPDGKETVLATFPFTMSRGMVRAQSPIEEDTDRSLRLVIEDGEGPFTVIVPGGHDAGTASAIPDATDARLRAGRGIAIGDGHVLASLDGGATWNEVPTTPAVLAAARAAQGSPDPEALAVSEMGARVGTALRLGWGTPEAPAALPDLGAGRALAPPTQPAAGAEHRLRCTSAGPGQGLAPLKASSEVRDLLATKPKPGVKRDTAVWSQRLGSLEAVALLEEDSADKREAGPTSWSFRWHDPREIGGKIRSATVKPPAGAAAGTTLRFMAADGGRALFVVRSGGKVRLVRVKPGGGAEVVDAGELSPTSGEIVFGTDNGDPIAWIRDTQVVVWLAGERPRVIAEVAAQSMRALGTPTAGGVPILVSAMDWALTRTLPIPAFPKGADKAPPPAPPALDGWTRLPSVKRSLPTALACGPKAAGTRFHLERRSLRASVDGFDGSAGSAHYAVRVAGAEICVEGLSAALTRTRPSSPKAGSAKGPKGSPPAKGGAASGADYVRVDLVGKKAEGGDRGAAASGSVRKMKCELGPGP